VIASIKRQLGEETGMPSSAILRLVQIGFKGWDA